MKKLLLLVAFQFVACLAAQAQSLFEVRFDTVTAKAGDTVTVYARYRFTPSGPHDIMSYTAQFDFDTTEVHLLAYVFDGTATPAADTNLAGTSHRGISAFGTSEIDLSDSLLFGIRFRVDRALADTAFVRWDTTVPMFASGTGVDSVHFQNGWVRTISTSGHVVLGTPAVVVRGFTLGYSPDSVAFELPVLASGLDSANIRTAVISFVYDSTALSIQGFNATPVKDVNVVGFSSVALPGGLRRESVSIASSGSGPIPGNDTLLRISFVGLVGLDTNCTALEEVSLRPSNPGGLIGNTDYTANPICLEGERPSRVSNAKQGNPISLFPNPAVSEVTFVFPAGTEGQKMLEVYDALGRMVWSGAIAGARWTIPVGIPAGSYTAEVNASGTIFRTNLTIAP